MLGIKNAFLSLTLASVSQAKFYFEWTNAEDEFNRQLTWTWLPQEFKSSPNIFDVVLHEDSSASLLQYVDDLLIAAETLETCKAATKEILKIWGDLGYVSKEGSTLPDWGNLLEVHIWGVVVGEMAVKSKNRDHPEGLQT